MPDDRSAEPTDPTSTSGSGATTTSPTNDDPNSVGTKAPAPGPDRTRRLQAATRSVAIGSAQLILIVIALVILGRVFSIMWVVLLPVVLGLLFTTVLWPLTRFLRSHSWPPALAAATVLLGFLAVIGGIFAVIVPQVVSQVEEVANQFSGGLQEVQGYLAGPPFNLDDDQVGNAVQALIDRVQSNATQIASYAASTAATVGNIFLNLVLALLLTFFFLKDGPKWVPWLAAQTGPRAAPHVAALSVKTWSTLSEFIKQQALVGFVDAFFIGLGLLVLGVPLVLPLTVLTFFGAFIPIIGAFAAGAFAVLIALVSVGLTKALIVLGIVVLVQQLEGNVLQPILQGRGLNLHAAVVILAVTAGSSMFGIIGAFLSVPVAALIAVFYRYGRDQLDGLSPEVAADGTSQQLAGDSSGAQLVRRKAEKAETAPLVNPDSDGAEDAGTTTDGQRIGLIGNAARRLRLHR
ncbi:AI-2E family transporter [Modestobacter sp. VKM Ac-2986]|uniref:AI-2E family transporter n=1 Tax=Modestobacter sp. VKM Ac-2986 TaxID=3004140 RepID=UPI0022ABC02D|nr:AI-2E family transporter [Modestobacter sp. VKM Ac-2986]MCZ2829323.1 AI-2E family transporter [Modestobacter sp. VKM Ac-2986]